jgi:hypothetical protein
LVLVSALALLASCVGAIGDGDGPSGSGSGDLDEPSGPGGPTGSAASPSGAAPGSAPGAGAGGTGGIAAVPNLSCNPAALPPLQAWRRLSATQYINTLRDLLTWALKDAKAANGIVTNYDFTTKVIPYIPVDLRQNLPLTDPHGGSFRRLDQDVDQAHVEVFFTGAQIVAGLLRGQLGTIAGACATDKDTSNDADCVTSFIQSFGEHVLRRPLEPDDVAFYRQVYGDPGISPAGFTDLIAALLSAPGFLYHVEHGEAPVAGKTGAFVVSAYELANRLSYQFWETMPDAELWNAAKTGSLKTPAGLAQQVSRLLADPRARTTLDAFFYDWLKVSDLNVHGHDFFEEGAFQIFAGDPMVNKFNNDDWMKALRASMVDDVLDLTRYYTWTKAGTFNDLLASNLSFARGPDLSRFYGVGAWDGSSEPPALPPDQRPGLLTRAALLTSGGVATRPIEKGAFIRKSMLCDAIPPPPGSVAAVTPPLDPKLSTRQVVERLTETPGTACAACHAGLINPLGYASENFDAIGRARTEEVLIALPAVGQRGAKVAGKVPVDTRAIPQIVAGDMTPAAGMADVVKLMLKSGKAQTCFARNYFRFTFGRWEKDANDPDAPDAQGALADGCIIERLRKTVASGGSLRTMFADVALAPEFQVRRF